MLTSTDARLEIIDAESPEYAEAAGRFLKGWKDLDRVELVEVFEVNIDISSPTAF